MKTEGSGQARMVQLMRQFGYNRDVTIELAKVVTPLPNLSVLIESDGLTLQRHNLILTDTVANKALAVGDQLIVIGDDATQQYFVIDKAVI